MRSGLTGITIGVLVLAAACGDSDERLTKAEYIEQANTICGVANTQFELSFEQFYASNFDDTGPTVSEDKMFAEMSKVFDDLAPVAEAQLADLRALAAPSADEATLLVLYEDFEATFDDMRETIAAAAVGDSTARAEIEHSDEDPFADVNRRAREYGLAVCGDPGEA